MDTSQGSPHLNEPAPDFDAKTTHGKRKLADYKGKWLILFSHLGDFTPFCTTEFIAFAKAYPKFQKRNCDLLGLSIDSTFSHIAWVQNIKQNFEIDIPFPIIDDKGILRAMVNYPMSNGRSIREFLRLLTAMQTSDKNGVATPVGWQIGDKVITTANSA